MGKRRTKNKKMKMQQLLFSLIIAVFLVGIEFVFNGIEERKAQNNIPTFASLEEIPEYSGNIYICINNNIPYFKDSEYITESFEMYSNLDELGRCGVAYANICKEIMPTETRKSIDEVKPTGWIQKKYNGEYLYNRCHLIGHQLAGEDANKLNLITGTRYFNVNRYVTF